MDRRPPRAARSTTRDPTRVGMDRWRGSGVVGITRCPRAWGWTAPRPDDRGGGHEIPTRVGMDRRASSRGRPRGEIPTRVGMDRLVVFTWLAGVARSPRAWGWTGGRVGARDRGGIRTRVGMHRIHAKHRVTGTEIPTRVGMDRPRSRARLTCRRDPHARGIDRHPQAARGAQGEIPTRVGMDRSDATTRQPRLGDPHARGDGPTSHMNWRWAIAGARGIAQPAMAAECHISSSV